MRNANQDNRFFKMDAAMAAREMGIKGPYTEALSRNYGCSG